MPAALIQAVLTRSDSPAPLLFWCGLGFVSGIFIFVKGFQFLQRRKLILDTPFSKIRSASMGMVEVSGLAVGSYTMLAPLTQRPCYYYRTLVWEYKQSGKNKEWVKVAGECAHLPFFLDDNTGRVLVDPRGADLDLHQDFKEEFSDSFFTTKDPVPSSVHSFLGRHGVSSTNRIKVEEFCIKPKNSLFILGTLSENPGTELTAKPVFETEPLGPSQGLFTRPLNSLMKSSSTDVEDFSARETEEPVGVGPHVIRLSTDASTKAVDMSQQQKIAAALMKAGITNPAAWSAAGLGAPSMQVTADATPADGFDPAPAVALKKGSNNGAFLISWRSQREVAARLGWKCALMISGGPALSLASLYLLLRVFHWL
ncbi:MAG: GIDE domain-containing protein [Candidatus Sulfotelmatobacter sp.]